MSFTDHGEEGQAGKGQADREGAGEDRAGGLVIQIFPFATGALRVHSATLKGPWQKASALCLQIMKKKAKPGKGKQAGKVLTKTEPVASFFNFFQPPQEPEEGTEMEEEEIEELREALEADFELG